MSKTIKYLIAGLVLLTGLLIFTSNRSCSMSEKSAILQGKVDELSAQNVHLLADLEQKKIDYNVAMERHNKELDRIRTSAAAADVDHDSELYKARSDLAKRVEAATTLQERVDAFEQKDIASERIITDLEQKIVMKDGAFKDLDSEWKKKERDWIDFSAGQDKVIEEMKKEITYWKNLTDSLKKDIGGLQLGGKVKTGVAIGLAVAVVYGLVT
ncbi:hypothetical protein KAT51_00060 [bacterium]|nr:hypothetical protein [bacterium]